MTGSWYTCMSDMNKLKDYEQYCKAFQGSAEERRLAGLLFLIRSHILRIQLLDSIEAGFVTTDTIINHYQETLDHAGDYITYPARKVMRVFRHIVEHMRTNILHENVMMPIYKANEFNSQSIGWLSRRPGRNIHEKLAGTRSIMAVHRRMTTDTSENRLFKAMARRMEDALLSKEENMPENCRSEDEKFLCDSLRRFRTLPEVEEILPWRNLPPNNTLLADKNYNIIWRAWNDIENINRQIVEDQRYLDNRLANIALVMLIYKLGRYFRFPQQPIFYHYDEAYIEPVFRRIQAINADSSKVLYLEHVSGTEKVVVKYLERKSILVFTNGKIQFISDKERISTDVTMTDFGKQIDDIVKTILGKDQEKRISLVKQKLMTGQSAVVDLFHFRPTILHNGQLSHMPGQLLYQELSWQEKSYLLDCCESLALLDFQPDYIQPYTIRRLVDEDEEKGLSYLNHLLSRMYQCVHTHELDFIFPDTCNEFQLSQLKRVARMYYRNVTAFSKSLAAVFTFVQDTSFKNKFCINDVIFIIDRENDGTSITMIRSIQDKVVQREVAELKGITWEHHPAEFYPDDDSESVDDKILQAVDRKDVIDADSWLSYWQPDGSWSRGEKKISSAHRRKSLMKIVDEYKKRQQHLIGKNHVWVISLAEMHEHLPAFYSQIDYSKENILEGVCHYKKLHQKTVRPLWRDCLPDLAIKRLYGKLDLVKNSTFEYGETLTMDIPVESTFRLPKGHEEYHFQLYMANANNKVTYQAIVQHPVFPLEDDAECQLHMRYIYGNDNPYSLKFVPQDKENAGFNEVEVIWKRIDTYPFENLKYPGFPLKNTWKYLSVYPDKDNKGTRNLLTGVIDAIRRMIRKWDYMPISDLDMKKTANWILFCLHSIYFNGRYAGDADCPPDIRPRLKSSLNDIYELYCSLDPDSQDALWLFSMLCIAGRDVDDSFASCVIEHIHKYGRNLNKLRKEIGFMLGDFSLPYQQEIAQALDELPSNVIPLILSKAAWRNEMFVFNFPQKSILYYFDQAIQDVIDFDSKMIKIFNEKKYQPSDALNLQLRLEFIMAVFRLRRSGNPEIDKHLSMNNILIRKLYQKVEELIRYDFSMKSRIQLEVHQGEEYRHYCIPDFMYALLVYITGDSGDSDIVISSINEG